MKINLFVLPVIMFFLTSCTSFDSDTFIKNKEPFKQKVNIAVLPFSDAPGHKDSGINVSDAITGEVIKIKNWNIVERYQLPKILKEQTLEAAGLTAEDYNKIGKISNIEYIIVGSVSEYYHGRTAFVVPKTKLVVNMRIINITNGEIAGTGRYVYETGKRAWAGCCILGFYYLPVLLLSEENINKDLNALAARVAKDINKQIGK